MQVGIVPRVLIFYFNLEFFFDIISFVAKQKENIRIILITQVHAWWRQQQARLILLLIMLRIRLELI